MLKATVVKYLVPAHQRSQGSYAPDNDGWDKQAGSVFFQKQLDAWTDQLEIFLARSMTPRVPITPSINSALLFCWGVLLLWSYLKSSWAPITTDHYTLKWISNLTDSTGKLTHWQLGLSKFKLDIVHGTEFSATPRRIIATKDIWTTQTPMDGDILVLCICPCYSPTQFPLPRKKEANRYWATPVYAIALWRNFNTIVGKLAYKTLK